MTDSFGANLLKYSKQKYIIWDTETCNLNLSLETNRAWQLSFLICDKDRIYEEFDFFPWWSDINECMGKDAARITGFNFEEYKSKACDANKALDIFEKYLYNKEFVSVGNNHFGFDFFIHNLYRKSLGLKTDYSYVRNGAIDTNCLAKMYKMNLNLPLDLNNRVASMYKLAHTWRKGVKTSLGVLGKEFDIPHNPNVLHSGIEDCRLNYEVFKKLLWLVVI